MTSAINPSLVMRPALQTFNEGAGNTNTSRIAAIALSVLACLASFMLLPAEGAFMVSAGIVALLSMLCCCTCEGAGRAAQYIPIILRSRSADTHTVNVSRPLYTDYRNVPNGMVNNQPVLNVGPRAAVGGGHRPPYNEITIQRTVQPRPAVFVNGNQVSSFNAQPVVNPGHAFGNPARVPVGHGHR